ncbi:MAG TPA: hypothetical protein VIM02_07535, partial [Rhizomicrobium sp.]
IRNVLIAIGNSGDRALAGEATFLLDDDAPLIRGAAVWALSKLISRANFAARASDAIRTEADESVRGEWRHASASP